MTKHKYSLSDIVDLKDAVAKIRAVQCRIEDDSEEYQFCYDLMSPIEEAIDVIESRAKGET